MNMQRRKIELCYELVFWIPALSGQLLIYNDATGLSAPKLMSRPLLLNNWLVHNMILFYFSADNLVKQDSCAQILFLFWYVNRIVEPKTWVSSFSYQGIILFQIFGFSLLLLADLADLTIHPHRQLSFSQTEDDDDAHQDCDQQRQHNCPPKHKNCQWKKLRVKLLGWYELTMVVMLCHISGIPQELFYLNGKRLLENILRWHTMTYDGISSLFCLPGILDSWHRLWTHSQPPSRRL